jgi:radical SAM protein with 4Fe4S-binding SPASM domain
VKNISIAQSVNKSAANKNIPLSVLLELTYRCNLGCYYCYISPKPQNHELTGKEWIKVLDQLSDMGVLYLTLSGGEIFTRKDIFEILFAATERSFAVSLITNGTFIDKKKAKQLASLNLLDVGISFLGSEPGLHDQLSGEKGSFAKAFKALCLLKNNHIRTIIKHSVSSKNFGEFIFLAEMAEKHDAFFECDSMIVPNKNNKISPYALTQNQQREFLQFMKIPPLPFNSKNNDHLHCDAGRSLFGISPYGDMVPCIQLNIPFGNIRKESIKEIWQSAKANVFRENENKIGKTCMLCPVKNYCARCPGLALAEKGRLNDKSTSNCLRTQALFSLSKQHSSSMKFKRNKMQS